MKLSMQQLQQVKNRWSDLPRKVRFSVYGFLIATVLLGVVSQFSAPTLPAIPEKYNLLSLLDHLNGTTNDMLQNTEQLQQSVMNVQNKLGELNAQEAVLQQQAKTGAQLQQELTTQVQLTSTGVSLMGQILEREKTTAKITSQVADQAGQLAGEVQQNAAHLGQLVDPLQRSLNASKTMNGQLDELLAELGKSQDSFKLFGKLNDLLGGSNLPGTLQAIEDSLLPDSVKSALLKLLPVPAVPTLPGVPAPSTGSGTGSGSGSGSGSAGTGPTLPTLPTWPLPTLPTLPIVK